MHNLKLIIAYDGTKYLGWQKGRTKLTIEEVMQRVVEQIVQHPIMLQAASRTDAGVHAEGQVVNFLTPKRIFDLNKFKLSLNSLLPKDIIVLKVDEMAISFHPTLDCIGKEYRYFICLGPTQLPHRRLYSWHVPYKLNQELIKQAIPMLIGTHDFSAFCKTRKNTHYSTTVREIQLLECLETEPGHLLFRIQGNHFLYRMVRNIVGTLIDIGKGKMRLDTLPHILEGGNRSIAGVTAPAHGLFLFKVCYPEGDHLRDHH